MDTDQANAFLPLRLMPSIASKLDPAGEPFRRNRARLLQQIERLRSLEARTRDASAKAKPLFDQRGQLLPRERIARLVDRGAPLLELSTLAGLSMHDDDGGDGATGGGNIIAIGFVGGVRCMVSANDSAIKGGSVTPMGLKKSLRAQEIAHQQKLPAVSLTESGGANLLHQSELFVDGGRIFCNLARASALGLPHICVVHGSSTA
ncbi:MAG: carboxyl transferase domain-containing protein, partial [Nevskiales bacterium]